MIKYSTCKSVEEIADHGIKHQRKETQKDHTRKCSMWEGEAKWRTVRVGGDDAEGPLIVRKKRFDQRTLENREQAVDQTVGDLKWTLEKSKTTGTKAEEAKSSPQAINPDWKVGADREECGNAKAVERRGTHECPTREEGYGDKSTLPHNTSWCISPESPKKHSLLELGIKNGTTITLSLLLRGELTTHLIKRKWRTFKKSLSQGAQTSKQRVE